MVLLIDVVRTLIFVIYVVVVAVVVSLVLVVVVDLRMSFGTTRIDVSYIGAR
jgi:hypothetical protein